MASEISEQLRGSSTSGNLAYACVLCNRHKSSDITSIDPRTGEAVRLLRLNAPERLAEPRLLQSLGSYPKR